MKLKRYTQEQEDQQRNDSDEIFLYSMINQIQKEQHN